MLDSVETKLETMVEDLHIRMIQKLCNSGSDNEVQSYSKTYAESYARLKKLYDEQRGKLGDASVEITAYTLSLKMVEAQLLCHQLNQLAYEQKIKFMKIDLDDKIDVLTYHKKLLVEALKEKEDLKTKVENWQKSSQNLNRLLNTQMSANDKFRLGYKDYRYGSILSYENEVLQSVFLNKECDLEDTHVNHRYANGMHAVPPPMKRNYMPSGPDVEIDYFKFTYGPKQTLVDESDAKTSENATCESDTSVETTTSMPATVEDAPKVVSKPKVWTDAPIIEEYESDSDDDLIFTHLIRDCDLLEKRIAKHAELATSKTKVTGQRENGPLWNNVQRVNHQNKMIHTKALKDKGIVDSRYYQDFKGGSVTFRGSNVRITGKGKIKAGRLNFEDVYYVEELKHYNLFSMSQMYDKKNKVLFTDTDCLVLSPDFKLPDENHVLLKIPRQHKNQANKSAGPKEANNSAGKQVIDDQDENSEEIDLHDEHFVLPIWSSYSTNEELEKLKRQEKEANDALKKEATHDSPYANTNNTNLLNVVIAPVSAVGPSKALNDAEPSYRDDPLMPHLEDIFLVQVYVDDIIFGSTKKSWCDKFELMKNRFQMSSMGELTFFLGLQKPLVKDEEVAEVTPKTSHLLAMKRIFRYLKGQPKLGLWYPKVSSFDLEAYSNSDYAGVNLNRKSTARGCQFLSRKLISWQCKKHTIVVASTTKAEYVVVAHCCGQVLWIQNQLLDYGFNLMNTKIYIDNKSTICIVKNPVFHFKTKHIEIRHHFIRDAYEKKLIQVLKIHTNDNVADLLTKAFDVSRFKFLVVNIRLLNL
nr:putative ribonuclease H-like domain-containing protein [Tanacetum cinerariifolium]